MSRKYRRKRRLGVSDSGMVVRMEALHPNHVWRCDFVEYSDFMGRPLRFLRLVEEFTRECVLLEVERSMSGGRVRQLITEVIKARGAPGHIRSDNGSEFIETELRAFLAATKVQTLYIEPASPWKNGYGGSFNGRLRDELLSSETFETLVEAKYPIGRQRLHCNHWRPQRALGKVTPAAYAANCAAAPPLRRAPLTRSASPQHNESPLPCSNSNRG